MARHYLIAVSRFCDQRFYGMTDAVAKSARLEKQVPQSRAITGNLMMPGFTAPKLVWVQRHEPDIFYQIDKVLLPKDFLRLRMTGVFASDMSDAAGTMWLDVKSATGATLCSTPVI